MDLSPLLQFLSQTSWTYEDALSLARAAAAAGGLKLDHDRDAGESWIMLYREDGSCAYIHCRRPIVIAQPGVPIPSRPPLPVIILSTDLDAAVFTASPEALDAAFPDSTSSSSSVVADHFSLKDLWFTTI